MPSAEILKKIDINQDFNITQKELNDFLNNKNTKEEDIKAVADELNKDNQYLLVMIESTLNTSHDDIVNKIKKNQELSKTDILIFKLRRYLIQNKKNTDLSSKGNRTEIYADVMKINAVYKSVAFEKKKAWPLVNKNVKETWNTWLLEWLEDAIEHRKEKMEFVSKVGRSLIDILEDRKSKLAPNTGKIAWELQLAINTIDKLITNPENLSVDNILWDVVIQPDGTPFSAGKKFETVKNTLVDDMFASFSTATTYANTWEVDYSLMAKWVSNREKIPWTKDLNAFVLFMKQKLYGEYALTSQYKWTVLAKIREYGWAATSEKILWYLKDDILKNKELGDIWAMRAIFQKILEVQKPKRNLIKMDSFDAKQIVQKIFGDSIKDPEVREELEDYVDDAIDDFKEQKKQILSKEWKKDIAKSAVMPILQQYYGGNPKDIRFELKAEKVAENISNNDSDPFDVEGLEELWKDLHNPESGVKIDIYKMVLKSQASAIQMTAESILSDKLIEWTLEAYSSSVTKVRWKNMAIELYADILGVWPWELSDKNIARIRFRWKEIAIQIISIAISWWIAWVATKWVMLTSSLFLRSVSTSARILKFANNIRKFYLIKKYAGMWINIAEGLWLWTRTKLWIGAIDLAVEWSLFHVANTFISSTINNIPRDQTLWELTNLKWYFQSIAYFGVLKAFSKLSWGLISKPMKSLGLKITDPVVLKNISQWIQIPLETMSMLWTDMAINLMFGEGFKSPTREDVINTLCIVVGLKLAHGITWDLSKIKDFEAVRDQNGTATGEIVVRWKGKDELTTDVKKELGELQKYDASLKKENASESSQVISQIPKNFKELTQAPKEILDQIMNIKDPGARTAIAEFLLKRTLTDAEKDIIQKAHAAPSRYTKAKILMENGFSKEVAKFLMDWWVCWEVMVMERSIKEEVAESEAITSPNTNYESYLEWKLTDEVLDARWEIYEFKDKDTFVDFLKQSKAFQSKFGIEPKILEEFVKNAFNYGAKNNPVSLTIKKVWGKYEFSTHNLWKFKNAEQMQASMNIARNKAKLANTMTQQEARLLQLISKSVCTEKEIMDILATEWKNDAKKMKIRQLAAGILERNNGLYKKLSEELGTSDIQALSDHFAWHVREYQFKRTSNVEDGAGNGIMFVKEKTWWTISYETTTLPSGEIVCEAKITVDAKTVESKAAKFNEKMNIVPEKTLAEEVEKERISQPNPEAVQKNATLQEWPRLKEAEKLLGKKFTWKLINPDGSPTVLWQKILDAHNIWSNREWAGVYNYTQTEILQKARILNEAWFTPKQRRILLENGICWQESAFVREIQEWIMQLFGKSKTLSSIDICTISLWWYAVDVINVQKFPYRKTKFNTPYVIVDHKLFEQSNGTRWYKWLREWEVVTLWRSHLWDRFDYTATTSRNHAQISLNDNKLTINDLYSSNSTIIKYDNNILYANANENQNIYKIGQKVLIPRSDWSTSEAIISYYDSESWKYRVAWNQWWQQYYKLLGREALDKYNVSGIEVVNNVDNKISGVPNTISNFQNLPRTQETQNILSKYPQLAPKHVLKIEGKDFYFSPIFRNWDRNMAFAYVNVWWKMETRFFYFSQSWGNRHSCPGVEKKRDPKKQTWKYRFSKWEFSWASYEKWSVADNRINSYLNSLSKNADISSLDLDDIFTEVYWNIDGYANNENKLHSMFMNEVGQANRDLIKTGEYLRKNNDGKNRFSSFYGLNAFWAKVSLPENMQLNTGIYSWPDMIHNSFGLVKTSFMTWTLNGKHIKIQIAHVANDPWLCWVENIIHSDSQLTSYGILNNQIHGWVFTAKPIEYASQVPYFINKWQSGWYVDVRPYIQGNPIIKSFKWFRQNQVNFVKENAQLSPESRIVKAEELLGSISSNALKTAILQTHNQDGTIFNLNFSQIKARVEILNKAGFTSNQIRILIENGICGQAKNEVLDVNKDGVFDSKDVEMMKWVDFVFQQNPELANKGKRILNGELVKNEKWELVKNPNYQESQKLFSDAEAEAAFTDLVIEKPKLKAENLQDKNWLKYVGITIDEDMISSQLKKLESMLWEGVFSTYRQNQLKRDNEFHVTLITPPELDKITGAAMPAIEAKDLVFKWIGKLAEGTNETFFVVVECPKLNEYRKTLGLEPKNFHLTLWFKEADIYTWNKGKTSLIEWKTKEQINIIDETKTNREIAIIKEQIKSYTELYTRWDDINNLARKIVEKWNKTDGKDYFKEPGKLAEAKAYAEQLLVKEPITCLSDDLILIKKLNNPNVLKNYTPEQFDLLVKNVQDILKDAKIMSDKEFETAYKTTKEYMKTDVLKSVVEDYFEMMYYKVKSENNAITPLEDGSSRETWIYSIRTPDGKEIQWHILVIKDSTPQLIQQYAEIVKEISFQYDKTSNLKILEGITLPDGMDISYSKQMAGTTPKNRINSNAYDLDLSSIIQVKNAENVDVACDNVAKILQKNLLRIHENLKNNITYTEWEFKAWVFGPEWWPYTGIKWSMTEIATGKKYINFENFRWEVRSDEWWKYITLKDGVKSSLLNDGMLKIDRNYHDNKISGDNFELTDVMNLQITTKDGKVYSNMNNNTAANRNVYFDNAGEFDASQRMMNVDTFAWYMQWYQRRVKLYYAEENYLKSAKKLHNIFNMVCDVEWGKIVGNMLSWSESWLYTKLGKLEQFFVQAWNLKGEINDPSIKGCKSAENLTNYIKENWLIEKWLITQDELNTLTKLFEETQKSGKDNKKTFDRMQPEIKKRIYAEVKKKYIDPMLDPNNLQYRPIVKDIYEGDWDPLLLMTDAYITKENKHVSYPVDITFNKNNNTYELNLNPRDNVAVSEKDPTTLNQKYKEAFEAHIKGRWLALEMNADNTIGIIKDKTGKEISKFKITESTVDNNKNAYFTHNIDKTSQDFLESSKVYTELKDNTLLKMISGKDLHITSVFLWKIHKLKNTFGIELSGKDITDALGKTTSEIQNLQPTGMDIFGSTVVLKFSKSDATLSALNKKAYDGLQKLFQEKLGDKFNQTTFDDVMWFARPDKYQPHMTLGTFNIKYMSWWQVQELLWIYKNKQKGEQLTEKELRTAKVNKDYLTQLNTIFGMVRNAEVWDIKLNTEQFWVKNTWSEIVY